MILVFKYTFSGPSNTKKRQKQIRKFALNDAHF